MTRRRTFRDDTHQAKLDRDGFVIVDLLDAAAVTRLRAVWESGSDRIQQWPFSSTIMSTDLAYREAVHQAVVAELGPPASHLLSDYRFCLCTFIAKNPARNGNDGVVDLHQDWSFVDESQFRSIGVWCPLSDVDETNGCLRVVPGSHLLNAFPRTPQRPFPYPSLLPVIERHYLKSFPIRAGQAFFFTQTLFHGSAPNVSGTLRLAAGAMAIPNESPLLFFIDGQDEHCKELAVYRVEESYYRTSAFGGRPAGEPVEHVPIQCSPLTEEQLHARLAARP